MVDLHKTLPDQEGWMSTPASNHPYRRFASTAALKKASKSVGQMICENQIGYSNAANDPTGWNRFPDEKYRNATPFRLH